MQAGGILKVKTRAEERFVSIEIEDNGSGMDSDALCDL